MPDIFKRTASALVAAAILLTVSVFYGCGIIIINDSPETPFYEIPEPGISAPPSVFDTTASIKQTKKQITTSDAKAGAQSKLDNITVRDLGGISVFIASTSPDMFAPGSVDNDISEARYIRQKLVEEKLNTKILTIGGTAETVFVDLRAAENAGLYYADIIAVPISQLGKFIAAGLLLRINALPFIDLEAEWFNTQGMTQATAGHNSAYTIIGDANLEPGDHFSAFWNKDLAASVSAGNLYKLTYNGVWTWDYLLTCARAVSNLDDGIYGLASSVDAETFISAFYAASGENLFETGADGMLSAAFGTDRASSVTTKLAKLFAKDAGFLGTLSEIPASQGVSAFYGGNSAFIITALGSAEWFKNMKSGWGILPIPKYDEKQSKYYSYLSKNALSFSTPYGNQNIEMAGVFISAFSAATDNLITNAFYTHLIKNVIRDNNSLNMMDIICGGTSICFADIFASGYPVIMSGASSSLYNAVRGKATMGYYYKYYAASLDAQVRRFT